MTSRILIILTLLIAVLALPFALRTDIDAELAAGSAERLVIISPHNESIRSEFGFAFAEYMAKTHQRKVFVDWRQPGGTSEIARFLRSEYATRFEQEWKEKTALPFDRTILGAFMNAKINIQKGNVTDLTLLGQASEEARAVAARGLFLSSDLGVGIDLFFGGGAYDFDKQAGAGTLVASDASGEYGPKALAREHPEWFTDSVIPESVSGEPFRDPEFRWLGTVLSSFGICYNTDVLKRLGFEGSPEVWADLADPRLYGQLALADPTKSGSTTKAFEMLIQERIQSLMREENLEEKEAISKGWNEAMRMILKISANGRYFTDSSTKVPRDVALGDAAAGMSIDFYGRTFNEVYKRPDGTSRAQFVTPAAGTSIGADPIGLLRGAASPELAHRFIEYVLSEDGQKLWNYRPGTEGGPKRFAIRRPPIRRDFYTPENLEMMTDPESNPYELAKGFTYHPEWTGPLFTAMRFLIKATCIEPHEEQQAAWGALIAAGLPADGVAEFEEIPMIDYQSVADELAPTLRASDKVSEVRLARELAETYRTHYLEIAAKWNPTD